MGYVITRINSVRRPMWVKYTIKIIADANRIDPVPFFLIEDAT